VPKRRKPYQKYYFWRSDKRRADWKRNHLLIYNMLILFTRHDTRYTESDMARECGLSLRTVNKHIREIDLKRFYERYSEGRMHLGWQFMDAVMVSVNAGNVESQILWDEIWDGKYTKKKRKVERVELSYKDEELERFDCYCAAANEREEVVRSLAYGHNQTLLPSRSS